MLAVTVPKVTPQKLRGTSWILVHHAKSTARCYLTVLMSAFEYITFGKAQSMAWFTLPKAQNIKHSNVKDGSVKPRSNTVVNVAC